MPSRRTLAVAGLLTLFLAVRVVAMVLALNGVISHVDILRYLQIAHANGRPYASYDVEYPPVFVAVLKVIGAAFSSDGAFTAAIISLAMAAELAIALTLWRFWRAAAALFFLFLDSFLIGLFLVRLDLVVTALALGGVAACLRGRGLRAALLMVLAIGMKLWPVPLAAVGFVITEVRARLQYATSLAIAGVVLLAAWVGVGGGVDAIKQVVTFRGSGGWQVESAVGSVVHLVTREHVYTENGAERFGHAPPAVAIALYAVAAAVTVWMLFSVKRRTLGSAWVASVGAFMVCSTLLSPQFVAWIIPAAALAWAAGDRLVGWLMLAVTVFTVVEDALYQQVTHLHTAALALVVVRNSILVATVAVAAWSVQRARRAVG